jgi:Zn-dependent M28 family amino/carboxypeptidase
VPLPALLLSLHLLIAPTTQPAASAMRVEIETLSTTYADRDPTHPAVYAASVDYLEGRLEDAGHAVRRQTFEAVGVLCHNLIVELPGTEPGLPMLIVGAHHDAVPTTPGADDNATGVAAVLELARRLKDAEHARPIRLILWANEEPPHFRTATMGSVVAAQASRAAGEAIFGVISVDMIGYFSDEPNSQRMPPGLAIPGADVADFVAAEGEPMSGDFIAQFDAAWPGTIRLIALTLPREVDAGGLSDHWSYQRAGYPGLILTDTSFFRNRHYHRPTDTPATLDFDRFEQVVDDLEQAVRTLANP